MKDDRRPTIIYPDLDLLLPRLSHKYLGSATLLDVWKKSPKSSNCSYPITLIASNHFVFGLPLPDLKYIKYFNHFTKIHFILMNFHIPKDLGVPFLRTDISCKFGCDLFLTNNYKVLSIITNTDFFIQIYSVFMSFFFFLLSVGSFRPFTSTAKILHLTALSITIIYSHNVY